MGKRLLALLIIAGLVFGATGPALSRSIRTLEVEKFDEYGGVGVIDWIHHQNHLGKAFTHAQTDLSVGSGASKEFLITTPDSEEHVHLNLAGMLRGEGACELYIFEAPTVSAAGTPIILVNRNRNKSGIAAATVATHTPTTSADGLQVYYERLGAGVQTGGTTADRQELELLADSMYLIRSKSLAAGNDLTTRIDFYEAAHSE